jgi:V/A-type H+-transporting ATPase subunit G/H
MTYMPVKDIIEKIRKEAEKQAEEILANAEKQAQEILAKAKEDAEKQAKELAAKHEASSKEKRQEIEQEIRASEKAILSEALDRATEAEAKKVAKLVEQASKKRFDKIVEQAAKAFAEANPEGGAKAIASTKYKPILEKLGIEVEAKDAEPYGLLLKSADGKIYLNVSASEIAKQYSDEIESRVYKELKKRAGI